MRTSVSHPLEIDCFPCMAGRIGMTLCPGRKGKSASGEPWDRDLSLDIAVLSAWGAQVVVTLIETTEMKQLGVQELGESIETVGITWIHLPIPDTSVPTSAWFEDWLGASRTIRRSLQAGESIVIHCKAGLERTALVAALLLGEQGFTR